MYISQLAKSKIVRLSVVAQALSLEVIDATRLESWQFPLAIAVWQ
jgi:hypothetical protein